MNPTEIPATIIGNLTADPELRFTSSGRAVVNFAVAVNERKMINGEWADGETVFVPVTVWESMAENVVETLSQGMPVMVYGRWVVDRWEDRETGQRRERMKVDAVAVGPNLRWAVASVRRPERRPQTRWTGQDDAESMIKEAETAPESKPEPTTAGAAKKTTARRPAKKTAATASKSG